MVREHLAQALRHVAESERRIAEQRAHVIALYKIGRDTTMALTLLGHFEELLAMHAADRDQLQRALDELDVPRRC